MQNEILKFKIIFLAILFGFLGWVQNSQAASRYVKAGGSCAGQSPCYATIQSAVNASSAGDTVYVMGGTYNETVTFSSNYSPSGLTVTRYGTDSVTITGVGSGEGSRIIVFNGSRHVTLSRVTLSGARQYLIRGSGGQQYS